MPEPFVWFVWLLQGLHDRVLEDCVAVLKLNENNFRALYRKAKALKELGRFKEAYDAVAKCSLAVPQVSRGRFPGLSFFHTVGITQKMVVGGSGGVEANLYAFSCSKVATAEPHAVACAVGKWLTPLPWRSDADKAHRPES